MNAPMIINSLLCTNYCHDRDQKQEYAFTHPCNYLSSIYKIVLGKVKYICSRLFSLYTSPLGKIGCIKHKIWVKKGYNDNKFYPCKCGVIVFSFFPFFYWGEGRQIFYRLSVRYLLILTLYSDNCPLN